jgi:hypothetical protein
MWTISVSQQKKQSGQHLLYVSTWGENKVDVSTCTKSEMSRKGS